MMLTSPPALLRIEEGAVLLATLFVYRQLHFNWLLFALLFLTPDLFMLGYLLNVRAGAAIYNLVHTLTLPLALLLISYLQHWPLPWPSSGPPTSPSTASSATGSNTRPTSRTSTSSTSPRRK